MGVVMKQFIDRFKAMEKVANETLAANPDALVGVESLPGSEHDAKVPEEAKKPNEEVTQGQPAGATSTSGAVAGGDAKPLNEGKLEMDQALADVDPKKFPEKEDPPFTPIDNDALAISSTGYNAVDSAHSAYSYDFTYSSKSSEYSRTERDSNENDEDGDGYDDETGEPLVNSDEESDDEDSESEEEEEDGGEEG